MDSINDYGIVTDLERNPITQDNKILLYNKNDTSKMIWVHKSMIDEDMPSENANHMTADLTEMGSSSNLSSEPGEQYGSSGPNHTNNEPSQPSTSSYCPDENGGRSMWTKKEILRLISLYADHETYFKNTTIKNDKVWKMIAGKLTTHTADQCKYKFKYLKSKYMEVKYNMSGRRTGERKIRFEYFDELDEVFHNDHNVNPASTASSSNGINNVNEDTDTDKEEGLIRKQRKRSVLERQLERYDTSMQEREEAIQKRHREIMEKQDKAISIMEKMANALVASLDNKK